MSQCNGKPATEVENEFSKISRKDFPEGFVFGTGTSAYQHEGGAMKGGRGIRKISDGSNGNTAVDMYTKYKEDIKMMKSIGFDAYRFSISWPRILPGGKRCLGVNQEGIDFYNDIINTLLANGIEPYVTLFHWDLPYVLEKDYGGFLGEEIVKDFREFAELCFWEFGDRVKNWITLNEPWTYCIQGYVQCVFPPGNKDSASTASPSPSVEALKSTMTSLFINPDGDKNIGKNSITYRGSKMENPLVDTLSLIAANMKNPLVSLIAAINTDDTTESNNNDESKPVPESAVKDVYTVARNLLLAHAEAVQSYRNKFKEHQKGQIGITLVSHWFKALNDTEVDKAAAKRALDFMLGWFLEPVLTGQYPQNMIKCVPKENLEQFTEKESELLKGSLDFLGLNYYTARYAANDPNPSYKKGYYFDGKVAFSEKKVGEEKPIGIVPPDGIFWLNIVPWGIYKLLKRIKETYKNVPAIYITENGVAETDHKRTAYEACADETRVNYHRDHLGYVLKAINEKKVDVKGYFAWSWCDNFEWDQGYGPRFGLIYIDYMNNLKRYPKHSAMWFAEFLARKTIMPAAKSPDEKNEKKPEAKESEEKHEAKESEEKPEAKESEKKPEAKESEEKPEAKESEEKPEAKESEEKHEAKESEEKPEAKESEKKPEAKESEEKHEAKESEEKPEAK
ncbi:hypothetical protein BUALT_Bualt10G0132700 [Buddleja alternifolia]|uniref:Beta-glucosidase n=1 Tax=Buddleja alternifolia TaxID=168488 RepID=A0AAV6WYG5_9LAMI|nr:hypothetical protein BUALT_Bualt10G0132700 [Buddleja alternifolia]